MAKLSSKKRPSRLKKDAGCMWGLINLFDFRQRQHSPRLLSDKKSGSSRQTGNGYSRTTLDSLHSSPKRNDADNVDEGKVEKFNLASVKTLIEKEMSQDSPQENISNDKAQHLFSEIGSEVQIKNTTQRSKNSKTISDACVNDLTSSTGPDNHQSGSSIDSSTFNTDLTAFLIKFYSHGYQLQQSHIDLDNKDGACISEVTSEKVISQLDEPDSLLDDKQPILKKALADLAQMITSQSYSDEETSNGSTQSNEFLDVLNTLNTNKESFLKILEHPDSLFLKQFQDFQNGQAGKISKGKSGKYLETIGLSGKNWSADKVDPDGNEHLHKQNKYSFFWKHRSKVTVPSQEKPSPQTQNRIVVLKPNPDRIIRSARLTSTSSSPHPHLRLKVEDNGEKAVPIFSLREIKRRIKNMFGDSKKARHAISMDGILHKVPIGSKDSTDTDKLIAWNSVSMSSARKSSPNTDMPFEAANALNKKDKQSSIVENDRNIASDIALPIVGNMIYDQGRKHLARILDMGDQRENVATARISKPLGRILSLPEYAGLPTIRSSKSEQDIILSPRDHKLISPQQNHQEDASSSSCASKQNLVAESCSNSILHHELQMSDLKIELFETHKLDTACIRKNADWEGTSGPDIFDMTVTDKLDANLSSNDYQANVASEIWAGEEESLQGSIATQTAILSEFAPSSSPVESILLSPACPTGKPGRKSPPSVLERFYSEDTSIPEWMTVKHSRHQLKPRQLSFEDGMLPGTSYSLEVDGHSKTYFGDKQARLAYIKAVLEASQLSNEHSESWYWADHLLEISLFEEVGTSSYQLQDDPKLLFDCINEVLSEIQERHYNLAFITQCVRPTPVGPNLIPEVSKAVDRCLKTVLPNTLDQIMKRSMDSGTWMNLRVEIEDMVIDIWDTLLDDLMEEAVFDLWLFDM